VTDTGSGVLVLVGLAGDWSDPLILAGLRDGFSSPRGFGGAAVSVECGESVVGVEGFWVGPPVETTTPGGAARTSSRLEAAASLSVVVVLVAVVAPGESAFFPEELGLAVATSGSVALLEAAVPAAPGESSAHASPALHPLMRAAPTPKVTAKPPTRLTHAALRIRYVYRRPALGGSVMGAGPVRSLPRGLSVEVDEAHAARPELDAPAHRRLSYRTRRGRHQRGQPGFMVVRQCITPVNAARIALAGAIITGGALALAGQAATAAWICVTDGTAVVDWHDAGRSARPASGRRDGVRTSGRAGRAAFARRARATDDSADALNPLGDRPTGIHGHLRPVPHYPKSEAPQHPRRVEPRPATLNE
jgi:hypothetical protein